MLFPSRLRRATISLRLGHARVLTPHRGVIHSAHAASLLPEEGFGDPVTEQGDPAGTTDKEKITFFESS